MEGQLESADEGTKASYHYALDQWDRFQKKPEDWKAASPLALPDGSPIGTHGMECGWEHP
ncbi:MAG: hypothetical protein AAFP92_29875, partial [Bacteroidota bacterium]